MQRSLLIKTIILALILILFLSTSAFALEDLVSEAVNKTAVILEKLKPENILGLLTSNLISFSKSLVVSFGLCLGVILISSVFSVLKVSFSDSENLFEIISCCLTIIIVFSPLAECFIKVQEHIEAICGFMISLTPTCVLLHTASGNTLSASLMSSATNGIITLLETLSVSLILPLAKATLTLTTANSICKNPHLTAINNTARNICLWITGLSFTLFTGILSLQSILQSGADNLAMKGLKYGAAKLIPIAGSMISESMKTVVTGVGYIKSVTGISGIIFIIYALIPPLCFILLTKLYLSLLSTASKICDTNTFSGFFDSANGIVNILLSVLLSISVSLIIILSIFIKTTVSI